MTYKLLSHERFRAQVEAFRKKFPKDESALLTALLKSRDDPTGPGAEPLTGIATVSLQGKLFRLHVGSGRGQRYIYLVHKRLEIVLAVYLSLELKANFKYDLAEIESFATEMLDDWTAQKYEKFQQA